MREEWWFVAAGIFTDEQGTDPVGINDAGASVGLSPTIYSALSVPLYKMLDCDVYLRGSCFKMPTLFRKEGLLSSEVAVSIFLMILTQIQK